jgi:hypothetical protein
MSLFTRKPVKFGTAIIGDNGICATVDATPDSRIVSLTKTAAVSVQKNNLTGQKAAVYLVLDHSGSMSNFYRNGSVQHLAEQALGLSANLDDDGTVPVVFFQSYAHPAMNLRIGHHVGGIDRLRATNDVRFGSTDYADGMRAVLAHRAAEVPHNMPCLVLFQTDGRPDNTSEVEEILRHASHLPVFWQFIGFGHDEFRFLRKLDTLRGRLVDNAGFWDAGPRPKDIPDADLYDAILSEFPAWLNAAKLAGVL